MKRVAGWLVVCFGAWAVVAVAVHVRSVPGVRQLPSRPAAETPEPPLAVEVKCDECGGTGRVDGRPCMLCPGTGRVTDSHGVEHECVMCRGTGKRFGPCPMCGGGGTLFTNGRRPPDLGDPDDALFLRLRPRIRAELTDAFEDAASDNKSGFGTVLAAAVYRLVLKLVKVAVEALVLAAVVALAWKYWWVVTSLYATAGIAGWLGGKKAGGSKNA